MHEEKITTIRVSTVTKFSVLFAYFYKIKIIFYQQRVEPEKIQVLDIGLDFRVRISAYLHTKYKSHAKPDFRDLISILYFQLRIKV